MGLQRIIIGVLAGLFICAACVPHPQPLRENDVVAVWDLENLSLSEIAYPDLGELLAAQVIETFKETGSYTVVEREKILLALDELNLGSSELADDSARLRLGRILQSSFMVFGSYQVVESTMRLDLRLVDVRSGAIVKASEKYTAAGDLSAWLEAAKEAADELMGNCLIKGKSDQ